ncbi:hypothetical protein [Dictyoglomus sp.]|uniref:hypothetical protein n=1 Tax=Dictyoglomus sp. TaxID=28205 RepID=UPI003D0FA23B
MRQLAIFLISFIILNLIFNTSASPENSDKVKSTKKEEKISLSSETSACIA